MVKKMETIFTLTVIKRKISGESANENDTTDVFCEMASGKDSTYRTWGFFSNKEDAESVVLNPKSDIFERYYNLAVIEEISIGLAPKAKDIVWYESQYENGNPAPAKKINKPIEFEGVINFAMG